MLVTASVCARLIVVLTFVPVPAPASQMMTASPLHVVSPSHSVAVMETSEQLPPPINTDCTRFPFVLSHRSATQPCWESPSMRGRRQSTWRILVIALVS